MRFVRPRPARRLLMVAVSSAAMLLPLHPASTAASGPHLHSGSLSGAGWVSYVFRTNGAEVQFDITARSLQLPVQLGAFVYDANSSGLGDKLVFSWSHLFIEPDEGIFLDSKLSRGPSIHLDTRTAQSGREFVSLTITMNDENNQGSLVGKYRILLWSAGAIGSTDHSLHGDLGSVYLGHETGDDTFLYTSTDFRGPLNLQVGTGVSEARVNHDVSLSLKIDRTMVGYFGPINTTSDTDRLWVDTPRGERECPCFFNAFTQAFGGNPAEKGPYRFHIDGQQAAPGTESEIILAGADANLSPQTVSET